jgi:sulfate adenylyltransferase subunit 1
MRWYRGPTLLALLEESNAARDPADAPFRLPVQRVSVPSAGSYHRGYMGRIESGRVRVGDTVRIAPSGQSARVRGLLTYDGALESATAPQSITILLDCELDISRGDVICSADCPMHALRSLPATLAWMDGEALAPHRRYLIKAGTRTVRARIEAIHARLDVTTLGSVPATDTLALNDIGEVTWRLQEPLALDDYGAVRSTGGFIVIDETSYRTVGAGVARLAQARDML